MALSKTKQLLMALTQGKVVQVPLPPDAKLRARIKQTIIRDKNRDPYFTSRFPDSKLCFKETAEGFEISCNLGITGDVANLI